MRFLAPKPLITLVTFQPLRTNVGDAGITEYRAIPPAYVLLRDVEEPADAKRLDAVLQQPVHRFLDRLLRLTSAQHAPPVHHRALNVIVRGRPRFRAAATAFQDFDAMRLVYPLDGTR